MTTLSSPGDQVVTIALMKSPPVLFPTRLLVRPQKANLEAGVDGGASDALMGSDDDTHR